jgi:hypothetical protein
LIFIDMDPGDKAPKRGDLVYTNIRDKRIRTWLILGSRRMPRARHPYRFKVWMARWWEIDPELRSSLYRSAERAGGQEVIYFRRYPVKKKRPKPLPWQCFSQ